MILLTNKPLDVESLMNEVKTKISGAISIFVGTVRMEIHKKFGKLLKLDYEMKDKLAEKKMQEIENEFLMRKKDVKILIAHRYGSLKIGEISFVVLVSSPHRRESFQICQEIVEKVKSNVPIWKKEIWEKGETWV